MVYLRPFNKHKDRINDVNEEGIEEETKKEIKDEEIGFKEVDADENMEICYCEQSVKNVCISESNEKDSKIDSTVIDTGIKP